MVHHGLAGQREQRFCEVEGERSEACACTQEPQPLR